MIEKLVLVVIVSINGVEGMVVGVVVIDSEGVDMGEFGRGSGCILFVFVKCL